MLKFGNISEVDAAKGLARVAFKENGIVSNWLPTSVPLSFIDQFQFPFQVNTHVWCMMDERCENGVIGGAIYDANNKPSSGNKNKLRIKIATGMMIEFDKLTGIVTIESATSITLKAPIINVQGNLAIAGAISTTGGGGTASFSGNVQTIGDVIASGKSLKLHIHTGVQTGGGVSGPPQ